jgi:hypothetical protein
LQQRVGPVDEADLGLDLLHALDVALLVPEAPGLDGVERDNVLE